MLGLALLLLYSGSRAALTRETWETRDAGAIAREAAGGTEAERLLASTAGERDPRVLLAAMRHLARMEAPDWIRAEALGALCEYFCVTEAADSLARRSAELVAQTGRAYDFPLQAPAVEGRWWLQVGAFSTEVAAKAALKALGGKSDRRVTEDGGLWKAQLGPYASRAEAERAAQALEKAGRLKEHRVVEAP